MKIFLFGSRSITRIPEEIRSFIRDIVVPGNSFLVGDCYGADLAWQIVLESLKANFTVYHIGSRPRNTLSPKVISVKGNRYTDKDDAMIRNCDAAICYHNNSPGSLRNIMRLKELGKYVLEFKQQK